MSVTALGTGEKVYDDLPQDARLLRVGAILEEAFGTRAHIAQVQ